MYLSPTIQASREVKIDKVIQQTGCSRSTAIAYLMAEEWFVSDAVTSIKIDQELTAEQANKK